MTILGADPDHLESTASRLLTHADGYDNACNHIGHWLRRMNWQGPEADRFRASFESQIRPQLDAAAAFLRETASELRAQAAAQTRVSQTPEGIASSLSDDLEQLGLGMSTAASSLGALFGGWVTAPSLGLTHKVVEDQGDSWLKIAASLLDDFIAPTPIGYNIPDYYKQLVPLAGYVGMATDFIGFGDLGYLRHLGKVPKLGEALKPFGVERFLGSGVGNVMVGAGVFLGALNLPGDVIEMTEMWDNVKDWPNIRPEDAAAFADATANSILDLSGMAGGFYTPVGLGLGALGYGMKAGAALDQPIIWACDNIIYPAWTEAQGAFGDVWDAGTEYVGDVADAGVEFVGDVAGAGVEFVGDVVGAGAEFLDDVWPFN